MIRNDSHGSREPAAWMKLVLGSLVLASVVLFLMQGYVPPGPIGDVIRNNQKQGIDATPFFYTEVESLMPD